MGDVRVRERALDGTLKKTEAGTGSAYFEALGGGRTRLVVDGLIGKETASFTIEGRDQGSGWRASHQGVAMDIAPDGRIRGSGTVSRQRFRFDGAITDAHFGLDVELEVLQSKPGGALPGTTFLFHYDLNRVVAEGARGAAAQAAPRTASGPNRNAAESNRRPCKRTVWQTRNVASLSSAPMIMVRVPKCVQW